MISLNIANLIPASLLALAQDPEAVCRQVLRDVATSAAHFWRQTALTKLGGSGADYAAGVQEPEFQSDTRVHVVLLGKVPNMIEGGWDGGDQREWLCGPTATNRRPIFKKDEQGNPVELIGWYNTVPFRWSFGGGDQVGRSVASLFGQSDEMSRGQSYDFFLEEAEAQGMARDIYREAQRLAPTTTEAFGPWRPGEHRGTQWGDKLAEGMAPAMGGHKTDPLAGMVRMEKTYERATQSQYMTFRRISKRSDGVATEGWVHPGITARHFAEATQEHVQKISRRALLSAIRRSVRAL